MDLAERQERRELDDGFYFSLEQNRQYQDVARGRLAEAGRDPDVIIRDAGEKNWFLLERGLSDESFAEMEAAANVLALLVRVARDQLEDRRVVLVRHDVERAVVGGDEWSELRHDELRHRLEILLPLHHVRELREVRLQPVLLGVLLRRGLQVRDHLIQVVLELVQLSLSLDRDLPAQIAARNCCRHLRNCAHL